MTTSEPVSNGGETGPPLALWPEEHLASLSPSPGRSSRKRMIAGFGPRSHASFAYYDHASSSWKTFQDSLVTGSETFSETWPASGMTRNGTAYRRPSSVPPMYADESSWWPTPQASDSKTGAETATGPRPSGAKRSLRLITALRMWPTPVADDTGHRKGAYSQGGTALSTVAGGLLNPEWVEWLMNFPPGWTDSGG